MVQTKEKRAKQKKQYYQNNKEKLNKQMKQWRLDNKEYIKKKDKEYYQNNKEKRNKQKRQWEKENPEKVRKSKWKSQNIISDDWEFVYDVYINSNTCDFCNTVFKDSLDRHLDHDHSITDNNNIRGVLCRRCNILDVLNGYPPIF